MIPRFARVVMLLAAALVAAATAGYAAGVSTGEVLYQTRFDRPESLNGWKPAIGLGIAMETVGDTRALAIERTPAEGAGARMVRTPLPIEKLRGNRVRVVARIKAQDVAQPPKPYNGIKCMLHFKAAEGAKYLQRNSVFGSFDWQPVSFVAEVPQEADDAWLALGLEQTTGKVWFDEVTITVLGSRRIAGGARHEGPVYKGHSLPRLRGTMTGTRLSEEDLRVLGGQWNANHIRWQLTWGGFPRSPADKGDLAAYDAWLDSALRRLDEMLPICRELGILVAVDLHTPPGGRNESSECQMFHEARFQDAFRAVWEKIATRYRGNPAVWGYDLVNEPVEGMVGEGLMNWHSLAAATARRVRQLDPDHAIIIEPGPWGSPAGLDWFEPLDVPGVVYSVHMYQPHRFTHQGVRGTPLGAVYPGQIDGKLWDKEELRKALAPAIRYQRDYNVQIYIGEFSAIRWAPGDSACRYLSDCIEIFEEYGWDWAYHAFREWNGWSVEHGPDPKNDQPAATPTDRQRLLQSWLAKNAKPPR